MKIQIRSSLFETNSSSTHTITLTSRKLFDDWKAGKAYLKDRTDEIVPVEEIDDVNALDWYDELEDIADGLGIAIPENKSELFNLIVGHEDSEFDTVEQLRAEVQYNLEYLTYEEWERRYEYLEYFETNKSFHGVDVVAFGVFGYEG